MARSSRAEWAKRVERWKDSGLTAKEFSAETGLNPSTLSYWRWRLGSESSGAGTRRAKSGTRRGPSKWPQKRAEGHFVQVAASAVTASPAMLEVVLNSSVRVRVPTGFDEATLTRVVRAVEAAR